MRGLLIFGLLALAYDALAQPPMPPVSASPRVAAIVVTDIAIAYTSDRPSGGLEVEPWTEGGIALGDTLGERLDYFTVVPEAIQLGIGGRLEIANIRIATHGLDGEAVQRAPLKISLEAPEGLLDIDTAADSQALLALRPGIGRLWIESLLPRGTGTGEQYRLPIPILIR